MALLQLCCVVSALLAVTMGQDLQTTRLAKLGKTGAELFTTFSNSETCRKVRVDDTTYMPVIPIAFSQSVYLWPEAKCPNAQTFNEASCECNRMGVSGRTAPITSCNVVADIGVSQTAGQFDSATYVKLSSQERAADLLNLTSSDGASLNLQRDDPLLVQSFHGNDLVAPWTALMIVKPADVNAETVLLSDECGTESGEQKSVELVMYQGYLNVYFRFTNDSSQDTCPVFADQYGEYKVLMTSEGTEVTVTVNDAPCITVDKKAKLAMTDCAMYVGSRYAPAPNPYSQVVSAQLKKFSFKKNPATC